MEERRPGAYEDMAEMGKLCGRIDIGDDRPYDRHAVNQPELLDEADMVLAVRHIHEHLADIGHDRVAQGGDRHRSGIADEKQERQGCRACPFPAGRYAAGT